MLTEILTFVDNHFWGLWFLVLAAMVFRTVGTTVTKIIVADMTRR